MSDAEHAPTPPKQAGQRKESVCAEVAETVHRAYRQLTVQPVDGEDAINDLQDAITQLEEDL
ncbi:hypothetical protein J2752_001980 [Halarchaeum rubridurum]|uniref:Uncharacterized protein n=1 Tax=Halarchaeum rubridurum TaxID=489911 RepID=A0A830G0F2_9EURY|nr:hypothetical protein [Halarchaeum rubridurum]MBP1955068.1 hypothetical protein [Halarchaeum rubridurum]GGM69220.1 hypothetical protein GCM10009017_19260 [Halarchaeum rubridurum]